MYHTADSDKMLSLAEYTEQMKEEQKYIYYACGETKAKIELLPQMERLRDKGYQVLCLTDSIDEFCMKMMHDYQVRNLSPFLTMIWIWRPRTRRKRLKP